MVNLSARLVLLFRARCCGRYGARCLAVVGWVCGLVVESGWRCCGVCISERERLLMDSTSEREREEERYRKKKRERQCHVMPLTNNTSPPNPLAARSSCIITHLHHQITLYQTPLAQILSYQHPHPSQRSYSTRHHGEMQPCPRSCCCPYGCCRLWAVALSFCPFPLHGNLQCTTAEDEEETNNMPEAYIKAVARGGEAVFGGGGVNVCRGGGRR
jgi:hypothetical protein